MKVLAYLDGTLFSGAESFLVRVLADLDRLDEIEIVVARPAANTLLRQALADAGFAEDRCVDSPGQSHRMSAFRLLDPRLRRAASRICRASGADVVLVNLSSVEHGGMPLVGRAGRRLPSAALLHLHQDPRVFGSTFGAIRGLLARLATRRLDSVAVLSSGAADVTRRRWVREDAAVVQVPIPRPTVRRLEPTVARRQLGLPTARRLVAFAGRLEYQQKGLDLFLEAADRIARVLPDVDFVIAGDGGDRERAEVEVERRGLASRVRFLGRVTDVGALLSAVDVLLIPSRAEGMPLLAAEALLVGTPGVACSVDGLTDIWPEQWRVEPEDADALASRALALLATPLPGLRSASEAALLAALPLMADDLGPTFRALLVEARERRRR